MSKTAPVLYPSYTTATIVIATSTTLSPEVDLGNNDLVGIITPSNFDGTTMTITAATASGGTFFPVAASNAASTAYTITTTASIFTPIPNTITAGLRFIKILCGSAQTTTDTVLTLVLRPKS